MKVPTAKIKTVFRSRNGLWKFFKEAKNMHMPVVKDCNLSKYSDV